MLCKYIVNLFNLVRTRKMQDKALQILIWRREMGFRIKNNNKQLNYID